MNGWGKDFKKLIALQMHTTKNTFAFACDNIYQLPNGTHVLNEKNSLTRMLYEELDQSQYD